MRTLAFRTGAIKWWWRYRHVLDGSYRAAPPEGGAVDPHRQHLWELVTGLSANSLIEIGCGDGANLVVFAREAPLLRLSAVDLNPLALDIAHQRVQKAGGTAGSFYHSSASHLPVADAFADIALSDAVFMYLPRAEAIAALREMRRVARRAIIVHTFADEALAESAVVDGNWVHDLDRLVLTAIPGAVVNRQASRIDHGQWAQFGTVLVATW